MNPLLEYSIAGLITIYHYIQASSSSRTCHDCLGVPTMCGCYCVWKTHRMDHVYKHTKKFKTGNSEWFQQPTIHMLQAPAMKLF